MLAFLSFLPFLPFLPFPVLSLIIRCCPGR